MNDIELTLSSDSGQLNLVTDVLEVSGSGVEMSLSAPQIIGGTTDYERLRNKPTIEDVELVGNKKLAEFGIQRIGNAAILNLFR